MRFQPSPIKAYRAAAGLGPTSEMGHKRYIKPDNCNVRFAPDSGHPRRAR